MKKIYIAAKIPEEALKILEQNDIPYEMFDKKATPSEKELIEKVKDADALIAAVNVQVTEKVIEANPDLKLIANVGEGYGNIDLETAKKYQIPVTSAPTKDSIQSTAELTWALLLAVSRRIIPGERMSQEGSFEGWQVMGFLGGNQVSGKTLTIIGFGKIGQQVARYAKVFDMEILYVDPERAEEEVEKDLSAKQVSLEEGLAKADYVSLNADYSEEDQHMMGKEEFGKMKRGSYFINCARGQFVDEDALADALERGDLQGAALDVHDHEPHMNQRLLKLNTVMTPHIGNDTIEARTQMSCAAAAEVARMAAGKQLKYLIEG